MCSESLLRDSLEGVVAEWIGGHCASRPWGRRGPELSGNVTAQCTNTQGLSYSLTLSLSLSLFLTLSFSCSLTLSLLLLLLLLLFLLELRLRLFSIV